MRLKSKAFLYQLISFVVFFIPIRFLIDYYTSLDSFWPSFFAFLATLVLAPKFQAIQTKEGEKLFMKWIFIKGIRSI
ncbi:hypothetical protein [Flavobacterium sp.]|uniref:hypothetical protein n=1 Tax=Flavobacterium sp. TaxID=239 RepID=UPI00352800F8